MSVSRTQASDRALRAALQLEALPPLRAVDRFAIRLGLALILRGQRHAEAAERAEHARLSRAAECAARSRDAALEHRSHAGPTW